MVHALRALLAATVTAVGLAASCGSPLNEAGVGCAVDGDCAAGLSCLALADAPGAGCKTLVNVCSKPCRIDGDCAAVAPEFKCFPTCDGKGTCSRVR